jgi:hypothetical protein
LESCAIFEDSKPTNAIRLQSHYAILSNPLNFGRSAELLPLGGNNGQTPTKLILLVTFRAGPQSAETRALCIENS